MITASTESTAFQIGFIYNLNEHNGGGKGKMVASASLGIGTLHGFWYVRLVEQRGDNQWPSATLAHNGGSCIRNASLVEAIEGGMADWEWHSASRRYSSPRCSRSPRMSLRLTIGISPQLSSAMSPIETPARIVYR